MELKVIESHLIPVYQDEELNQLVNARELHEFLEVGSKFNDWFKRMCDYGFDENVDYTSVTQKKVTVQGNESLFTDYVLTLPMAKEISMLQRNEKGKQARQYFIKIEEDWNRPEKVMARALKIAEKTINNLQVDIQVMKPKVEFFDTVTQSDDLLDMKQVASILNLGYGRNTLFAKLRELKILDQYNMPYQKYIDLGYFKIVETLKGNEENPKMFPKPCVYQKGLEFIRKLVKE